MKFKAEDFGPVKSADIDIRPLTVIIGKNNLGKSYLAELYYALLSSSRTFLEDLGRRYYFPKYFRVRLDRKFLYTYPFLRYPKIDPEVARSLARQIKKSMTNADILKLIIQNLTGIYARSLQRILRASLEKSFAVKLGKLVSLNSSMAKISWDLFKHLSLAAQITKRGAVRVSLVPNRSGNRLIRRFQKSEFELIERIKRARTRKADYVLMLYMEIADRLMVLRTNQDEGLSWFVRGPKETSAYYIPAGRGGLLESYETVVGGLVSLSPIAPVRGLSMPPLPGMAAQFYSVLLRLRGVKGPMSRIVSASFRKLLEGDVQLKKIKGHPKSRLIYRYSSGKKTASTEVIHAASMVKELSPIYLIVQELVRSGDFLLIEEPESHLHPGAQLKLVDIVAILVENGVNLFLTTHSDLLLRRIGHLVGRHRVEEKKASIDPNSLAIYWLKDNELGCKSEILKVSEHGGLEEVPTFDEIVKALYEEEIELARKARKEE